MPRNGRNTVPRRLADLRSEAATTPPQFSVIFAGKEGKYEVVRTPQLLVTRAGTFLALAQGRSGSHDSSDNDIIQKRSTDGGRAWSELQVVADQGQVSLNSICVLQVRETGRILIVGGCFPVGHAMMEFQYLSPGIQAYQITPTRLNPLRIQFPSSHSPGTTSPRCPAGTRALQPASTHRPPRLCDHTFAGARPRWRGISALRNHATQLHLPVTG